MLSLLSVRSVLASISATSCTVWRPTPIALIGIVKLPLVVPLLVTVAVSYWLPSTYRVTTFVPVPCTV